jgi:hypothetical protein
MPPSTKHTITNERIIFLVKRMEAHLEFLEFMKYHKLHDLVKDYYRKYYINYIIAVRNKISEIREDMKETRIETYAIFTYSSTNSLKDYFFCSTKSFFSEEGGFSDIIIKKLVEATQ